MVMEADVFCLAMDLPTLYRTGGMTKVSVHLSAARFCKLPGMEHHPFFPDRHERVLGALLDAGVLGDEDWFFSSPLAMAEVASVVSRGLLEQLSGDAGVAHAMCVPPDSTGLRDVFLPAALAACGATVAAARAAMRSGLAIHLGGGFHHASRTRAEGFCLLPDITLAVAALRRDIPGLPVMVIDLDAHHGNGVAADFCRDPDTFVLDVFNGDIYPRGPKPEMAAGLRVPLPEGCRDAEYLAALAAGLEKAFSAFRPGLVLFNAGADVLSGDPLGRMGLSPAGLARRDAMVMEKVRESGAPACILMAGGYSAAAVAAVAASLAGLLLRQGFGTGGPGPISRWKGPSPRGC